MLTWRGLATYYLLFFLHLETRRVTVAGIAQHATEEWMLQMARNSVDVVEGSLLFGSLCVTRSRHQVLVPFELCFGLSEFSRYYCTPQSRI